jgi:putative transposase
MESVHYHRRNLPHFYPEGAKFFITFRLYNSIPKIFLEQLKANYEAKVAEIIGKKPLAEQAQLIDNEQKRHFAVYDTFLDKIETVNHYLRQLMVAEIVKEALHHRDGKLYDLLAYCVMSNHIHLVIDTAIQLEKPDIPYQNLDKIIGGLKSFTANQANKLLGKKGHFWQAESYDRVIRNQKELENVIRYVLNNPVKAGIVENWADYPHSYCNSAQLYHSLLG